MNTDNRGFAPILIMLAILVAGAIGGVAYYKSTKDISNNNVQNNNPKDLVGNDKDSHGCIGSAGYSWCEVKNKCLRIWEEKCETQAVNSSLPPDKQRIEDIKLIQAGLEKYFEQYNSYPILKENSAINGQCLSSIGFSNQCSGKVFLKIIPKNPKPTLNGICSDRPYYGYNSDELSYFMDYCLESTVNGLAPGIHSVSKSHEPYLLFPDPNEPLPKVITIENILENLDLYNYRDINIEGYILGTDIKKKIDEKNVYYVKNNNLRLNLRDKPDVNAIPLLISFFLKKKSQESLIDFYVNSNPEWIHVKLSGTFVKTSSVPPNPPLITDITLTVIN